MEARWRAAATVFVLLFVFSAIFIFYTSHEEPSQQITVRLRPETANDENVWKSVMFPNAPIPEQRNIFFVETSCTLLDVPGQSSRVKMTTASGGLRLTARTACALEAAARTHPQRPVYLVHTCPIDFERLWATAPDYILQLFTLPNLHVWPVRLTDMFAGSSLEFLLTKNKLGRTQWPEIHASDILRLVLLWRLGGTYLDLDMLILRSLEDTHNFASAESAEWVNNAVLDFDYDKTGREVANTTIRLLHDYRPDIFQHHGPRLLTRLVHERCGKRRFPYNGTPADCDGFKVLPTIAFYPLHYTQWQQLFTEENARATMNKIRDSIAVHLWSTKSAKRLNVPLISTQPLAQIARRVCPGVATSNGKV